MSDKDDEQAALVRDAERYRFLRDDTVDWWCGKLGISWDQLELLGFEKFDEAVDKVMDRSQEGE